MATTTTLKQRAQSEVLYNPSNGYITPLGIEFPDGSVISSARLISISQTTIDAANISQAGTGSGSATPAVGTFTTPINGPNVVVEYQLQFGAGGTAITDGETCVLEITGEAQYSDGTKDTLDSKLIPVTSVGAATSTTFVSASYPLYFDDKQLSGIELNYLFAGATSTSSNKLAIGEATVDVYVGTTTNK